MWNEFTEMPVANAFNKIIEPFIETDDCKQYSEQLSQYVTAITVNHDSLNIHIRTSENSDALLTLYAPKEDQSFEGIPETYHNVIKHYRSAFFRLRYLEIVLNEDLCSGMYCPDEGWEDYFAVYAPDLSGYAEDLVIVMDKLNSDHYILHPTEKNQHGEPKVYYLGHDNGGLEEQFANVGIGGHFLRIISEAVTKKY